MSKKTDENKSGDLRARLETLGLSEKEARIYITLLPLKDVGSSVLIKRSGLHGQFVYQALERLEMLGLAQHVIQKGRRKFSPGNPERILSLVEEKKIAAQAVVKQLQESFKGVHEQSFEIYQGQDAFVAHEFALLEEVPDGSTIDFMGGGALKYIELMGHEMDAYEKRRLEKRIKVRYISTVGRDEHIAKMIQVQKDVEYRILPGHATGVDMDIYDDKVVYQMYGDPVVSFVFKNKQIAQGQKQFFEVLWNLSQK